MPAKASHKLKLARGTLRKDRAGDNPEPVTGRPVKPAWLGELASAKWDEVTALLESEGQLSPIYGDCIADYCRAFQDADEAQQIIDRDGLIASGDRGGPYQHPAVGIKNKALERMAKCQRQLGMTPASIKHVQKTEKRESDSGKKRFFG